MSSSTEGGKANKSGEMGTTILGRPGVCMGEKVEFLSAERDLGVRASAMPISQEMSGVEYPRCAVIGGTLISMSSSGEIAGG